MKSLLSFALLLLATLVSALSSTGDRLLAVLDDVADKAGYSKFLGDLESRGFKITYETPKSESLSLFHLGERKYDHVIFFPTKGKGLGPNLTPNLLLDFLNKKGNILLTLSSDVPASTSLVSLLSELDIALPSERTGLVVDHFNHDVLSSADAHDVLLLPVPRPIRPGVSDLFASGAPADTPLAFPRGAGVLLGPGPLLTPIVRAPATAYIYNPKEQAEALDADDLFGAGAQLTLVAGVQARNSARVAVVGSAEMLSNKWFDAKVAQAGEKKKQVTTYNREFAKRIAGWAFQEIGVLKTNWIEHRLNEAGPEANVTNPEMYRIKNDVTYTISLSQWTWDKWTGFVVPQDDDLQLEFSMLSPFHRLHLSVDPSRSTPESTAYTASFKLPDQHGIFNFKVSYKRPLLTNVEEKNTVSVRHMAHDEWPRSYVISGAYPWIAGIGATITAWLFFVAVWMFSRPTDKVVQKKTQ